MRTEYFSDDQLLITTSTHFGAGDDDQQPEGIRFLRAVSRLVKRRIQHGVEVPKKPAVFLLKPPDLDQEDADFCPMIDNGLEQIEGLIWFVSPVVTAGASHRIEYTTDKAMFETVIKTLKVGDVPAIVYDPRTAPVEIRHYPKGLGDYDRCEVVPILFGDVDLKSVFAVIDRVYEKQLVVPNGQNKVAKLWQNSRKHWPVEDAELTVQLYLETALNERFVTCRVRCEQQQVTGRLDIEIEEPDPSRPGYGVRHVVIELKVLRSFGSTGIRYTETDTNTWIDEGIDQAFSYREERQARESALCCFDMRKQHTGDACFDAVRDKAERLKVVLKVWSIFASLKDYRAHLSESAATR